MIKEWTSGLSNLKNPKSNPLKEMRLALKNASLYDGQEIGLFHPSNSAVVKIRENGMIDIFTATNQGIRIDPTKRTVNIIAEHEKHHVDAYTIWSDTHITNKCHMDYVIETDSNIRMKAKKNWTIEVDGDISVKAVGNVSIESGKSVSIKSSEDMHFDAPNYRFK